MRNLVLATLASLAGMAHAADPLLRCEAADGHITYTQGACPEGNRLTQVRVVEPERPQRPYRGFDAPRLREREVVRAAPPGGGADVRQTTDDSPYGWRRPQRRDQQRDQCEHVRARVEHERELAGNNRTFTQVRDWMDREQRACKGL